jgi:hypothetical protein
MRDRIKEKDIRCCGWDCFECMQWGNPIEGISELALVRSIEGLTPFSG